MISRLITVMLVVCCATSIAASGQSGTRPALQGVWSVVDVTDVSGRSSPAQPGVFVFASSHYSVVQVTQPRPGLPPDLSRMSANELLAVFGPAFNAQAGTFQVVQNLLHLRPIVAKNPNVMNGKTSFTYVFKLDAAALTLTTDTGVTYRLTRVE